MEYCPSRLVTPSHCSQIMRLFTALMALCVRQGKSKTVKGMCICEIRNMLTSFLFLRVFHISLAEEKKMYQMYAVLINIIMQRDRERERERERER